MPALKPTGYRAEIVWLGVVPEGQMESVARTELELDFDGPLGEAHRGRTRPACSRVSAQFAKGTIIANTRQMTLLSAEEMAETAFAMRIPELRPEWVGASVVLRGLPDFSHIPPSSRLQSEEGVALVVDMENRPCVLPGTIIEAVHPEKGKAYKPAATGRRGVTAWVQRPGRLALGQSLQLWVPDQRAWSKLQHDW
ncbi:sulfurase [Thioclava sp. GXIMD4216]|uniref:Sulfurase n=1 Tax=Thioclava litoralis TaxID=3076557 RepID=A0ABZ1E303_9RHOB|nr:sulfurase [Thioclava sp. FTW29]